MKIKTASSLFKPEVFLILFIASFLRIYNFWDWSFTNDELSALIRTRYPSIIELINDGVWIDGHPAFTQVFLFYWKRLVGDSVIFWRTPFVMASIFGTVYFYLFAKSVSNKNAALVALSILSTSQLFILYSQIARPYSFGFFFTMAFSYHWYTFITKPKISSHFWLLVFFGSLGVLTHYFTSLCIVLIILYGFFILKRESLKHYLAAIALLIAFHIPHLPIIFNHLSIGGLGWLPVPKLEDVFDFLMFSFNDSLIFELSCLLCLPIAFLIKFRFRSNKVFPLLLLLFPLSFLTAYFYSIYGTPIFQFSAFIFSFPYFIIFLTFFFSLNTSKRLSIIISILVMSIGTISLVYPRNFYDNKPFANFKDVANNVINWNNQYGARNIVNIANAHDKKYFQYYFDLRNDSVDYGIPTFNSEADIVRARELIYSSDKEFVLLFFANALVPFEVHEYTKEKYPRVIKQERHFISEAILYQQANEKRHQLFYSEPSLLQADSKWEVNPSFIINDSLNNESISYQMTQDQEYLLTYRDTVKNLFFGKNIFLTIKASIKADSETDFLLVVSVDRNGKNIHWSSKNVKPYLSSNEWKNLIHVYTKDQNSLPEDNITIYFWNNMKSSALIKGFKIINYKDSNYNYYEMNN